MALSLDVFYYILIVLDVKYAYYQEIEIEFSTFHFTFKVSFEKIVFEFLLKQIR